MIEKINPEDIKLENIKIVESPTLSNKYGKRYVIVDENSGEILDDAKGYGFTSIDNAKIRWGYTSGQIKKTKTFYAVKVGRVPGIYTTWDECKAMVNGYSNATFKSFATLEEAKQFLEGNFVPSKTLKSTNTPSTSTPIAIPQNGNYAFVDGSFNTTTNVYGFGGFLIHDGVKEILQGSGKNETMASMRNVAGEILGSMAAIKKAIELGLSELTIYYDYMGIEKWATGEWSRNKEGTIAYYNYVNSVKDAIQLHFVKVKGHSGVDGNEEADKLAKQAVGILS